MTSIKAASVGLLGLVTAVTGVGLWVLGDRVSATVPYPIASTAVHWAALIWVLGIIVMLSSALASTMRLKNYLMLILLLAGGYVAVFAVLVLFTSPIMGS
jgi:hypothetical protein